MERGEGPNERDEMGNNRNREENVKEEKERTGEKLLRKEHNDKNRESVGSGSVRHLWGFRERMGGKEKNKWGN